MYCIALEQWLPENVALSSAYCFLTGLFALAILYCAATNQG